jgi:tetratricopeptide (TPR) repeat protein
MKKLTLFSILFACSSTFIHAFNTGDSAKIYLQKGLQAKTERRWQLAINNLQKAVSFDSTDTEVLTALGEVATEMRQYNAAINAFEKLNRVNPGNVKAIENLANLYYWFRNDEKAIALATKMEEMKIGGARPHYIIGMAAYRQENYPIAINRLLNFLDYEPNNTEVIYAIGRSYVDLERYDKAIKFYEKCIELDSSGVMRIYELGMIYYNVRKNNKAIQYFELAAAKGFRQDADYFVNLGNVYMNAGNAVKGIELFKKALEKRPFSQSILNDLAYAYYGNKNYQEAIDTWDQVLQLDKTNARSLYMIGMAYQKKGEKGKGQMLCDKAIELDPSLSSMKQQVGGFGM